MPSCGRRSSAGRSAQCRRHALRRGGEPLGGVLGEPSPEGARVPLTLTPPPVPVGVVGFYLSLVGSDRRRRSIATGTAGEVVRCLFRPSESPGGAFWAVLLAVGPIGLPASPLWITLVESVCRPDFPALKVGPASAANAPGPWDRWMYQASSIRGQHITAVL